MLFLSIWMVDSAYQRGTIVSSVQIVEDQRPVFSYLFIFFMKVWNDASVPNQIKYKLVNRLLGVRGEGDKSSPPPPPLPPSPSDRAF